jgi:uncharacterized protein (DUF697 family)
MTVCGALGDLIDASSVAGGTFALGWQAFSIQRRDQLR